MGPVFGPLVVSGVLVREDDLETLRELGVKDSKKFGSGETAHRKRREVWELSREYVIAEKQVVIRADELDRANMYDLHILGVTQILRSLGWLDAGTIYVEQIGQLGRDKFLSKLGFWHSGFVYEMKADIRYAAVSLASIKAKIVRDTEVIRLCEGLGEEYVSGYANNKTEEFFRRYYDKHRCLPPGTRVSRNWDPIISMR